MSSAVKPDNKASAKSPTKPYKGKAKERVDALETSQDTSKGPAAKQAHIQATPTEGEDDWAWNFLADSTVSSRPTVLTPDGKYVLLRADEPNQMLIAYLQLLLLDHRYSSQDLLCGNWKSRVYTFIVFNWQLGVAYRQW